MIDSDQSTSQQEPSSLLSYALAYARKGWQVFPLHSCDARGSCTCGRPDCSNVALHPVRNQGVHEATRQVQVIRKWWREMPAANIGIATGKGLLVIEINPHLGGSREQLEQQYALPETATAYTPGGGWQLYFAYPPDLPLRSRPLSTLPGIMLKADEDYVLAPPSRHPAGVTYLWATPESLDPALIPASLLETLLPEPVYPVESSLPLLPALTYEPMSLPDLLRMGWPDPRWIISSLIPEGLVVLTGRQHYGKSWLACLLALSVASGEALWGRFAVEQGDVLYLGLEDTRRSFIERVRLLAGDRERSSLLSHLHWAGQWSKLVDGGLADLEDWLLAHPQARLVIIDTLASVYPIQYRRRGDPVIYEEHPMIFPLTRIAEQYHVAIMLVQHLRRPVGSEQEDLQEVAGLMKLADCTLLLKLEREHGLLQVQGPAVTPQELPLIFTTRRAWLPIEKRQVHTK